MAGSPWDGFHDDLRSAAYVDKLAGFEASGMSLWSDSVVMVADDDPGRSAFDRHSESWRARYLFRRDLSRQTTPRRRGRSSRRLSEGAWAHWARRPRSDRRQTLLQTNDVRLQGGSRADSSPRSPATSDSGSPVSPPRGGARFGNGRRDGGLGPVRLALIQSFRLGTRSSGAVQAPSPLGDAIQTLGAYRERIAGPTSTTFSGIRGSKVGGLTRRRSVSGRRRPGAFLRRPREMDFLQSRALRLVRRVAPHERKLVIRRQENRLVNVRVVSTT
jgi:hypothetical protein